MVLDHLDECSSEWAAIGRVAENISIRRGTPGPRSAGPRRTRASDSGSRPTGRPERMPSCGKSRSPNGPLRSSSPHPLLRGEIRPPTAELVAYIGVHRDRFGFEAIYRVLNEHGCKIAPNTYWAAKKRLPSRWTLRDADLKTQNPPRGPLRDPVNDVT